MSLDDAPEPVFARTPDLPECETVETFETALFTHQASFTSGRSQLAQRPTEDGGVIRVTRIEATFSDRASVLAIMNSARDAFAGPGLEACMLAAATSSGVVATAHERAALPVAADGVSRVLEYEISPASGGGTVTQALSWWPEGDRLLGLVISAAGQAPDDSELAAITRAATGVGQ